jgi:hypothetical protein
MVWKLALGAFLLGAVCIVGCKGAEKAAPGPAQAPVVEEQPGGAQAGAPPPAGLNPNYHGSAAADDKRTGSALKGK